MEGWQVQNLKGGLHSGLVPEGQCSCLSPNAICCRTRKSRSVTDDVKAVCWRFLSVLRCQGGIFVILLSGLEKGGKSFNWLMGAHPHSKGSLLHSSPHRNTQMCLTNIWAPKPSQLTHKSAITVGGSAPPGFTQTKLHELVVLFHFSQSM